MLVARRVRRVEHLEERDAGVEEPRVDRPARQRLAHELQRAPARLHLGEVPEDRGERPPYRGRREARDLAASDRDLRRQHRERLERAGEALLALASAPRDDGELAEIAREQRHDPVRLAVVDAAQDERLALHGAPRRRRRAHGRLLSRARVGRLSSRARRR